MAKVYITGSGPGAKELLTLKAAEVLQKADAVVYDQLIGEEIMQLIPSTANKIFAGKSKSHHHMPQEEINQTLVDLAKLGEYKHIVRLKGGDPFIFGRGGEEILYLAKNNVQFEVIPAVTSALGCGGYSNIPMTHRDYVTGVHFITGHGCKDKKPNLNWALLAKGQSTLVFYMGVTNASLIEQNLIDNGMSGSIGVAIIQDGTMTNQKVHTGTLKGLGQLVEANNVQSPAIILVGDVVKVKQEIDSFND